ncbi:MAG: YdeI/OmpD-associated family protein [Candidatus Nanopelagicales bacterium]
MARAAREGTAPDGRRTVHAETREQWRAWLAEHHAEPEGAWLVSWKKATGKPFVPYADAVEEGLCVGWVDSRPGKLDEERSLLWFAPRKRGSGWSRPNKERVERLTAAGLMLPAGLAVVEAARADGSWTKLDEVEDLVEPDDLRAALDAQPAARSAWDAFPRSAKRGILEWIVQAKKPETRATRVATTVAEAREGRRANQWRPRG